MKRVLALLFVGVLMGALDLAIVGPALPAMQADFQMNNRQLSWLFNIYVLFQLVGTPLLAKMSDRYGRRSIYVFSVSFFALGSLLLVLAMTIASPLVGKSIYSVGSRFIVQAGLVLVFIGVLVYGLVPLNVTWFIVGGIIGGTGLAGLLARVSGLMCTGLTLQSGPVMANLT